MITDEEKAIRLDDITLTGNLGLPAGSKGLVLFAHGSGSSRLSPRNRYVARVLQQYGLATLLTDLLTVEEEELDQLTTLLRFNIELLADRLVGITGWVRNNYPDMNIGYFGGSTGAAAALIASVKAGDINAVVSRGGRPDLASAYLSEVTAPTLLIVGSYDHEVIRLNEEAFKMLAVVKEISIVQGATHLFEEPGKLEEVASLAGSWFSRYLTSEDPA